MIIRHSSPVTDLVDLALQHRAIHHPYLIAIAEGNLPDPRAALTDFAIQYQGYTSWFPRFLHSVMDKLSNTQHREFFEENLREEQGHLDSETIAQLQQMGIPESWVQEVPHPVLFRRFQTALGIQHQNQPLSDATLQWRNHFLQLIERGSAAAAIGAMGLATEAMVKHIYRYILRGIRQQTELARRDYVFFELHCEVDDEHADLMLRVANDLVLQDSLADNDSHPIDDLRTGMLAALELRSRFWDALHARALSTKGGKQGTSLVKNSNQPGGK